MPTQALHFFILPMPMNPYRQKSAVKRENKSLLRLFGYDIQDDKPISIRRATSRYLDASFEIN